MRHAKQYMAEAHQGARIIIMDRKTPYVELVPFREHVSIPLWKRNIKRVKPKGKYFSETLQEERNS